MQQKLFFLIQRSRLLIKIPLLNLKQSLRNGNVSKKYRKSSNKKMAQINTEAIWTDKRSFTMIYHIYRWIVFIYISHPNHTFYKFQIIFFNKFLIIYSVSFSFNWRNNVILQYSLSFSVIIYTASHVFIFKYFQYLVEFTCILKVVTWFKRLYNINHKLLFQPMSSKSLYTFARIKRHLTRTEIIEFFSYHLSAISCTYFCCTCVRMNWICPRPCRRIQKCLI